MILKMTVARTAKCRGVWQEHSTEASDLTAMGVMCLKVMTVARTKVETIRMARAFKHD